MVNLQILILNESSSRDSWSSVLNWMAMTDSSDYRMYLESKFNALHEKLDTIVEQTVKTNNRVNHLEDQRDSYLKTRVDREMLTECHTKIEEIDDKVTIIEKDLQEYRFFKKYPTISVIIIALFTVGIVISAYGTLKSMVNSNILEKIESETKTTNDLLIPSVIRGEQYIPPAFRDTVK